MATKKMAESGTNFKLSIIA
ncbi:uncharacterized protein G2W53_010230 [Senna tora]|uniref:Uncharacterized protein n=1 Tax=Senna tora TaxID=362788 RepID=A0A834WZH8_9FABA|nr:uncharacterized protein G2W53_010230 [Senna tora]